MPTAALLAMLRQAWRIAVLAVAALAFLLALFLNYDGIGQALGLGALMTGATGRIILAALAALVVVAVVARFSREKPAPAPSRKAAAKPRGKTPAKKSTAARRTQPERAAPARKRARSPSRRR
jgi:membrane protein implicated in regulation of membrane protease activity